MEMTYLISAASLTAAACSGKSLPQIITDAPLAWPR